MNSPRTPWLPPYVLVGHSIGGMLVRVFADLFPGEVAGMVQVDAAHPDQHVRDHEKGRGTDPVPAVFLLSRHATAYCCGIRKKLGGGTIFISGGAALDPAIAEGFARLGVTLYQGYGITETSPVIAAESRNGMRPGTVQFERSGSLISFSAL